MNGKTQERLEFPVHLQDSSSNTAWKKIIPWTLQSEFSIQTLMLYIMDRSFYLPTLTYNKEVWFFLASVPPQRYIKDNTPINDSQPIARR